MAGKPAAFTTAVTQHGIIMGAGSPDVFIHRLPAWASGYQNICSLPAHGPETVGLGSETVLINGMRASRATDFLQGGGPPNQILLGANDVLIGGPDPSSYNAEEYCKAYCAMLAKWRACKTPEERKAVYQQFLADLAAKFGAPAPGIGAVNPPFPASFDANDWKVNVGKDAFDNPDWPPGPWATAHEMRHCEQSYMAMRASGDTSLTSNPNVQKSVADQGPLDPDSPAGRYGALHADNQLGGGKDNYHKILQDINAGKDGGLEAYKHQPGGKEGYEVDDMGKCGCNAYKE